MCLEENVLLLRNCTLKYLEEKGIMSELTAKDFKKKVKREGEGQREAMTK